MLHLFKLGRGRWAIVEPDNVFAQLRRADESCQIYAGTLFFQSFEILVERTPVHRQVVAAEKVFLFLDESLVNRRDGFTLAGDLGGYAHHYLAHRARIDEQISFRLTEHIDKARRHDQTGGVNLARGAGVFQRANSHDAIAFDCEISAVTGST